MTYKYDCSFFTGYKPCSFKRSCDSCPHYQKRGKKILVISLEAMGAVLRSTCLLPAIRRKFEAAHITWVTLPRSLPLLKNNPLIDRTLGLETANIPLLNHLHFDVLYAVDKSLEACALAETISADQKYGFGLDKNGVIKPLNKHAEYQYDVGLNDQLKFFDNQKAETQQITESMDLEWQRDPYILNLTEDEKALSKQYRQQILENSSVKKIIGYNTGCSTLFPYKKFRVEQAIKTVEQWRKHFPEYGVALLGGPEDELRQKEIKAAFAQDKAVINTPCTGGLRNGVLWINAADMLFSGCSLGMHIGIGLKKKVLAWFGLSCAQEVDLYERGEKLSADVSCSPCWKKSCTNDPKCFDQVSPERIVEATKKLLEI